MISLVGSVQKSAARPRLFTQDITFPVRPSCGGRFLLTEKCPRGLSHPAGTSRLFPIPRILCFVVSLSFSLYSCLCIFYSVFFSLYLLLCILLFVSFTLYSFVQLSWLLSDAFPVLLTALYRPVPHPRLPVLRTFLPPFRHKGNPVLHYRALHNLKAVGIQRFLHFLCFGIYDPGADKKRARRHQLRRNS